MPRLSSALLALLSLLLALGACAEEVNHSDKRVIVLGIDGLDPDMVRERIARGLMPNFKVLSEEGMLMDLQTSWPPQSPVAWSNFITGANPGKHGIYDFIHVDRSNYGLISSMSVTEPVGLELNLFGWKLPITGGDITQARDFPAFWNELDKAGVPVAVHRIPANYPLEEDSNAVVFPDMGTPDLPGAASGLAFLWFERSALADQRGWSQKDRGSYSMQPVAVNRLRLADGKGVATASGMLKGPADLDGVITTEGVDFSIDTTGDQAMLGIEIGGTVAIAELGDWSDWIPVEYSLMGGMAPMSGWTRVLFSSADPFVAYASPVQMDPWAPASPVSNPEDAAISLADAIGPYYTQGFPDAYKAYKGGLLTTSEFLSESDTVLVERMEMLDYALDEFDRTGGLLFFYTGSLDLRCHMLWHAADDQHPHREAPGVYANVPGEYARATVEYGLQPRANMELAEQIDRIYAQVDDMLGYLVKEIDDRWDEVELIVMSDHGFAPMHRVMNINDWLVQEGYLVLKQAGTTGSISAGHDEHGEIDWDNCIVDWSQSRAYAIGFNGVILNRVGREPQGIVVDSEADALIAEIQAKLIDLRDDDGSQVLTAVLPASEVFSGAHLSTAPDVQLGFNVGFGASDPSAEGKVTGEGIIVDNDSRWSGSHLMDPELVKGTFATRVKHQLSTPEPALEDITATLYQQFGVTPPAGVDGQPLFQ